MAKINFTEVEEGFPVWPEAEYPAVISSVELKQAKSKHFGFNFQFDPMSDEVKGKAFFNAPLHPNALWNTKQTLMRMGLDPDVWEECGDMDSEDEKTLTELKEAVEQLVGNEVTLIIVNEEYDPEDGTGSRMQNVTKKVLSAGVTSLPF